MEKAFEAKADLLYNEHLQSRSDQYHNNNYYSCIQKNEIAFYADMKDS